MAGSVNKVILIGNLGKDPEVRSFPNGGRVANFSIATSESWKDKSTGEKKERTEWHRISVLNDALVGIVERYVKKGMKVYIEGQLETRKWTDRDGVERYSTDVVLRPFNGVLNMLSSSRGGDSRDSRDGEDYGHDGQYHPDTGTFSDRQTGRNDMDDEIPF